MQLSGKRIESLRCYLTEVADRDGQTRPRRFRIVDKHGLSRYAYNLQIDIDLAGETLALGLDASRLPGRGPAATVGEHAAEAPTTDELVEDLSSLLRRRGARTMTEE